ncbi:NACHT domain-containing NTPase [Nocardiopsis sp. RV163]|uniref:NACHT domain-containing protein n=1 Tax=Nocardiopsis sp. RV163 TaxID=1661388 RepID=UPI0009E3BAC0|nr:NACHT domain-containing protein [Nocardiopsis sp. RV163]
MELIPSIAKTVMSVAPTVGKKVLTKNKFNSVANQAQETLSVGDLESFFGDLEQEEIGQISNFINSPQFESIALQCLVNNINGNKEGVNFEIRDQIRKSLNIEGLLRPENRMQATDFIQAALQQACFAARVQMPTIDSPWALKSAAAISAAGVRNSEILSRLENIHEIKLFASKMRRQVAAQHGKVRMASAVRNSRSVSFDDLYVPPSFAKPDKEQIIPLQEVLDGNRNVVIVGDPGAGKSTLSNKLAHDIVKGKIKGFEGQFPILLIVRNHTDGLRKGYDKITDYLEATCRNPYGIDPPEGAMDYLLSSGAATVIIDGVDELGEARHREIFRDSVESFRSLYPLARIIVTSRIVGYSEAALDEEYFPVVRIRSFDVPQVESYVKKWFKITTDGGAQEARDKTVSFMAESEDAAEELRENPLLLSLLCALYTSTGFIPGKKAEIYEKCAELLFETWDRSRGISVPFRWHSYIRSAVQKLAWRVLTDERGRQAFPKSEMRDFLALDVLSGKYESEDDAAQAAEEFLDFCAGRAWVLTDLGVDTIEPQYGFVHRTFLEYFASLQLVKNNPTPESVWEQILPYVDDGSRQVVNQLAVQRLEISCEGGSDRFLEILMSHYDGLPFGGEESISLLVLAIECLEVVLPNYSIVRRISRAAVRLACSVSFKQRFLDVGNRSDLARNIDNLDIPLTRILEMRRPEAERQLIEYICHEIEDLVESGQSSQGAEAVIYGVLNFWEGEDGHLGSRIYQGFERFYPGALEISDHVQGFLRNPSAEELRNSGISVLYQDFYFSSVYFSSTYSMLMRYFGGLLIDRQKGERDHLISLIESRLDGQYDSLIEFIRDMNGGLGNFREVFSTQSQFSILRDNYFGTLSPRARAAALLILFPVISLGVRKMNLGGVFSILASAPVVDSNRSKAIDIINEWDLPAEAHDQLVYWVNYGAFSSR